MKARKDKLRWIHLDAKAGEHGHQPILEKPFPDREESSVTDLAASITLHGILSPLLMREKSTGLEVVCGYRRLLAAQRLGLERIPAIVMQLSDTEAIRCYLSESVVRRPLSSAVREQALHTLYHVSRQEDDESPTAQAQQADAASSDQLKSGDSKPVPPVVAEPAGEAPPRRQSARMGPSTSSRPPRRARERQSSRSLTAAHNQIATNLLRRTEALFQEALERRILLVDRVEALVDSLTEFLVENPNADLRFLVPCGGASDPTAAHSVLVASVCHRISNRLGYSDPARRVFVLGGLLHDIGMPFVREAALRRPDILSESDHHHLHGHTRIGCALITATQSWSADVAHCAQDHHERHDGSGYPAGKRGAEVPQMARLMAIVDSLCTMISPRSHRAAMPFDDAWARLGRATERGLFDPVLYHHLGEALQGLEWSFKSAIPTGTNATLPEKDGNPLDRSRPQVTMPPKGSVYGAV